MQFHRETVAAGK